jgi:hypothetical protein
MLQFRIEWTNNKKEFPRSAAESKSHCFRQFVEKHYTITRAESKKEYVRSSNGTHLSRPLRALL